jgi:putative ABC transport system ATP-binding protein
MIELIDIEKVFQTKTIETIALKEIRLKVDKGEFVSVMGPSGSGKSTLLNIMGLIDQPSKGKVVYDGTSPMEFGDEKLSRFRNHKVGFIFQSFHLINDLSAFDNVELPLLYRKTRAGDRKKQVSEALEKVGLASRMAHYPSQLSGGQKQRVAIARAIVGSPEVILADEPTGNLDSGIGEEIMNILIHLNKAETTTIVMVTHDESLAKKTHRIVRLFDGQQVS